MKNRSSEIYQCSKTFKTCPIFPTKAFFFSLDFQGIGHGIPSSFLDTIRQVTKEFFEQPMEKKKKYSKGVDDVEGYGGDPTPEEGQFLDWQDRLVLSVYPEDLRDTRFWPESPKSFR